MQMMWHVVHPKLSANVAGVITAMVSAWSFLLTTMEGWTFDPKIWQESISYFSTLLDRDDRSVRIATGKGLALIFEIGNFKKFSGEAKASSDSSVSREIAHIQGLRGKFLSQVRTLSTEAAGKGFAKKDLNSQRNIFRDILEFLEDGYPPETSIKIGGESLNTTSWSELIQLNFLKHFIRGGFVKHMKMNFFLMSLGSRQRESSFQEMSLVCLLVIRTRDMRRSLWVYRITNSIISSFPCGSMMDLLDCFAPIPKILEDNGPASSSVVAFESNSLKIMFNISKPLANPQATLIEANFINKSPDLKCLKLRSGKFQVKSIGILERALTSCCKEHWPACSLK